MSPTRGCSRWVKGRGQKAGQGRCLKSKITNITFEDKILQIIIIILGYSRLLWTPKKSSLGSPILYVGGVQKSRYKKENIFLRCCFQSRISRLGKNSTNFLFHPLTPYGLICQPWAWEKIRGDQNFISNVPLDGRYGRQIKNRTWNGQSCTMRNRPPTGANKLYVANHPHSSSLSQINF